jgi:LacI family transcriptional regulator
VTLEDVAREAGVSAMTVSRVVRGMDKRVTQETAHHVRKVIAELGYQPDMVAKSLRGDPTRTIGLMLASFGGYFFSNCARTIDELAQNAGYSVLLAGTHENSDAEASQFNMLMSHRIDGLLVVLTPGRHEFLKHALAEGFPVVALEREVASMAVDSVVIENRLGARQATEHLLQHGHRRIACVYNESRIYSVSERIKGYEEAMKAAGLETNLLRGQDVEHVGHTLSKALLSNDPPTALFATNSVLALQILPVLEKHNLKIPESMAVIGFDDFPAAPYLPSPMTTVRQPITELGARAVELLFRKIADRHTKSTTRIALATELIVRRSCGCAG